jgi:hypothetical protein
MCAKGSAEIDYHTKLKMKTEPNKRFLDYDKGIPELLNDLDELSQRCGENAATNAQNLIIAVGKHAGIVRCLSEATDEVSVAVKNLTWAITILTVLLVILTIVMLCKMG